MFKLFTTIFLLSFSSAIFAQTDTVVVAKADTIRIGGFKIIKKKKNNDIEITMGRNTRQCKY